jgi:hypothetical protein
MNTIVEAITTIGIAIVGLAIVTSLVSKNAQTPQVVQSVASGFGNALGVAESPVTGATYNIDLSYPGQDFSGSFGTA